MPLSALVERQAREAVAAADLERQALSIVDAANDSVTAAEAATLLHCSVAVAERALDALADGCQIQCGGGRYEKMY